MGFLVELQYFSSVHRHQWYKKTLVERGRRSRRRRLRQDPAGLLLSLLFGD